MGSSSHFKNGACFQRYKDELGAKHDADKGAVDAQIKEKLAAYETTATLKLQKDFDALQSEAKDKNAAERGELQASHEQVWTHDYVLAMPTTCTMT